MLSSKDSFSVSEFNPGGIICRDEEMQCDLHDIIFISFIVITMQVKSMSFIVQVFEKHHKNRSSYFVLG